jgi:tRNA-2-methylthio-N6-dimethylallyladenosine synthase
VLVEGESKRNPNVLAGYTRKNKLVNFVAPKEVIGQIVKVQVTEAKTWSLQGDFIEVVTDQKVEL